MAATDNIESPWRAGDKCPQCREGLVERTELGYECERCGWNETIGAAVAEAKKRQTQIGDYKFRPFAVRIRVETPEEGEILLQGCIIARSNNNSPHFQQIIDGINTQLEPWRAVKLQQELEARSSGER
jgi:ribosomal protein L37AE/L43A